MESRRWPRWFGQLQCMQDSRKVKQPLHSAPDKKQVEHALLGRTVWSDVELMDKTRDLRWDNLAAVDKLGVRHSFTMSFQHTEWFLGVSQVVVVNTVVCYQHITTHITNTTTTTTTTTTTSTTTSTTMTSTTTTTLLLILVTVALLLQLLGTWVWGTAALRCIVWEADGGSSPQGDLDGLCHMIRNYALWTNSTHEKKNSWFY